MNYRCLVFLLFIIPNLNCSQLSCTWHMDKVVEFYDENYGFNYYNFSDEFFEYLIGREIIENYSKEELVALFTEKLYCRVDFEDYNLQVDHWLATGPGFGGSMIELSNTKKRCVLPAICLDSINTENSSQYLAEIVKLLEEDQIDNRFSKAFFAYMINIYFHRCQ